MKKEGGDIALFLVFARIIIWLNIISRKLLVTPEPRLFQCKDAQSKKVPIFVDKVSFFCMLEILFNSLKKNIILHFFAQFIGRTCHVPWSVKKARSYSSMLLSNGALITFRTGWPLTRRPRSGRGPAASPPRPTRRSQRNRRRPRISRPATHLGTYPYFQN